MTAQHFASFINRAFNYYVLDKTNLLLPSNLRKNFFFLSLCLSFYPENVKCNHFPCRVEEFTEPSLILMLMIPSIIFPQDGTGSVRTLCTLQETALARGHCGPTQPNAVIRFLRLSPEHELKRLPVNSTLQEECYVETEVMLCKSDMYSSRCLSSLEILSLF